MNRAFILILAAALLSGCVRKEANVLNEFRGEVRCERPRTALHYLEPRGKDSLLAAGVETARADRPLVMDSLASACQFSAREAGEGWQPMGAFEDGSGGLHLVYFNRYRLDRIMAGRKLHLCFNRDRKLGEIFVYEVPLE